MSGYGKLEGMLLRTCRATYFDGEHVSERAMTVRAAFDQAEQLCLTEEVGEGPGQAVRVDETLRDIGAIKCRWFCIASRDGSPLRVFIYVSENDAAALRTLRACRLTDSMP